jgi:hypothetical protein
LLAVSVLNANASEWTIRISVEKAHIRLKPDIASPVGATVLKGTILESYEKEGEWFRVIYGPDEHGFSVVGYIHSGDVEIIREKITEEQDFWPEEPESFEGMGLTLKLSGGFNYFNAGDVGDGTRGYYDMRAGHFSSSGYTLEEWKRPFNNGFDLSGDVIFYLKPKIGIGLGSGYIYSTRTSYFIVSGKDIYLEKFGSSSEIRAFPIRLSVYLSFPVHRLFTVSVSGGPALYLAEFTYYLGPDWIDLNSVTQKATSNGFGFHAGVGLEVRLNRRAAFVIEGQGRYAKISNFKGKETKYLYVPAEPGSFAGEERIWDEEGTLYYLEQGKQSYLAFFKEDPSGFTTAKKASFDLSGFSLRAGLIYRF